METVSTYPCPHCGYDPGAESAFPYALQPGTILNGKYVVGTVLGQGGFGITYSGWDLALESKVAIKEYFPSAQVSRTQTSGALQWYNTEAGRTARDSGREMFLKEARKMARVSRIPQVVRVLDLFQQNNTAYIVMDFVEGENLKNRLKKTGPLPWDQARDIFLPAIDAMERVHKAGLVHRDLSPDNLMLTPDGSVRILDLGAAKDLNINTGASSMQVAKGGFSPLEQYIQSGGSGPWTDVYAMAATMYFTFTGVLPLPSVDRLAEDTLRWDLPHLTTLPENVQNALKKAMAISPKTRTRSMGEFYTQLFQDNRTDDRADSRDHKGYSSGDKSDENGIYVFLPKAGNPAQRRKIAALAATLCSLGDSTAARTQGLAVWRAFIAQNSTISAGEYHTVGLRGDGTVTATGSNVKKQCDVHTWTGIISIAANGCHTVGLKADGTVVAVGQSSDGQCNTDTWKDIVAVSAGGYHTVGLRADGTVAATGWSRNGQCDVADWKEIVAVSAGNYHTVGVKADGTMVAAGDNQYGQCDVSKWKDIVAVSAGGWHTVGLKADGTVVAAGFNRSGQCDVSSWKDIVAVSTGKWHTVGLRANGTVVVAGANGAGQCNVSSWKNIVAIHAGYTHTVGLTANGTVIAVGENGNGQCNVSDWKGVRLP